MKPEILNKWEFTILDSNKNKWHGFINEVYGNMSNGEINWITYPNGIDMLLLDENGNEKESLHCEGTSDIPDRFTQTEVNNLEYKIQESLLEQAGYAFGL